MVCISLQAFFGLYSTRTFRRFSLFFLALGLAAGCGFTLVSLTGADRDTMWREVKVRAQCRGQSGDQFCVYNTTRDFMENSRRVNYYYDEVGNRQTQSREPLPLPLACIAHDKVCDGKVDLVGTNKGE